MISLICELKKIKQKNFKKTETAEERENSLLAAKEGGEGGGGVEEGRIGSLGLADASYYL